MWLLRKINSDAGAIQYLISEKKCYTVGRKSCDIVLSDSSISRTHCVINIAPRKDCPFIVHTLSGVWVIDQKSKYGTFIEKDHTWVKIEAEKIQELSNGTVIRFGLMENIWRLEYKPIIACTSRLSSEQTQELKLLLAAVDGKLINKWVKQCSIVFVNDITLTVKVLLALINGIPIVTLNYLKELVENVKQNLPWPDHKLFKPEIAESTLVKHLVSLNTEDHRKELFKGKKFIIPTEEQLENLREIIVAAGGETELLKLDGNWRKLAYENTIVIQLPCNKIINPDQSAYSFKNLTNVLKNEYHVRVVPETEIFQAIAYSSVDKYCNPKSDEFEIRHSTYNQNSCGDILEDETPTQSVSGKSLEEQQIGSTLVHSAEPYHCSSPQKSKIDVLSIRKRNRSPEHEVTPKRVARGVQEIVSDLNENKSEAMNDLFWEESTHEECVLPAAAPEAPKKESLMKNLKTLNTPERDSVADKAGTSNSLNDINKRIQQQYEISDHELDEFWRDHTEKPSRAESEKRKCQDDSLEMNEKSKRRRIGEEDNSRHADPEPKEKTCRVVRSKSENGFSIAKSLSDTLKSAKVIQDNSGIEWIRRKNANCSSRVLEESQESDSMIFSVKKFRKSRNCTAEKTVDYSPQTYIDIGSALMADGWYRSHACRRP